MSTFHTVSTNQRADIDKNSAYKYFFVIGSIRHQNKSNIGCYRAPLLLLLPPNPPFQVENCSGKVSYVWRKIRVTRIGYFGFPLNNKASTKPATNPPMCAM
jgi:hypothetical protein